MDTLTTQIATGKKSIDGIISYQSVPDVYSKPTSISRKNTAQNELFKADVLEQILKIAKRFSDHENERLKLFSNAIDLELNYATHRISQRFSEEECSFEILEFYHTKRKGDKKLGKLKAIELWLQLIFKKTPYSLACTWGENYEGYYLQISINKEEEQLFSEEILDIYHTVKVLLDTTNRFTNCPNELVESFTQFKKPALLVDFFNSLKDYCRNLDYSTNDRKADQNFASYILTFVTIKPDVLEQILLRASKGYSKFLAYCHKRTEYAKPFKQNYFRHWKTMNLEKVLLLTLCVKYPQELYGDYCDDTSFIHTLFKKRDLNLHLLSREDVNPEAQPVLESFRA